jgi:hypothetical protein
VNDFRPSGLEPVCLSLLGDADLDDWGDPSGLTIIAGHEVRDKLFKGAEDGSISLAFRLEDLELSSGRIVSPVEPIDLVTQTPF